MTDELRTNMASPRECVGWLCHVLASEMTSSGQLSSLRKQSAGSPSPSSWWLLTKLEERKLNREIGEASQYKWHTLVKLLSLLTSSGTPVRAANDMDVPTDTDTETAVNNRPDVPLRGSLHQPSRSFGAALFAAGYSESRLASLLNARELQADDQLIRACRFLLAKKETFDCRELADFIFNQNPEKPQYDQIRQRVARGYFRAAVKHENNATDNTQGVPNE